MNSFWSSRFQTDALERRFSQYRQMNGGRFLVSLKDVNNSDKILRIRSLLKENINFWEENLLNKGDYNALLEKFTIELENIRNDIYEAQLSNDSRQVATYVAGYIAKKMIKRFDLHCDNCKFNLVSSTSESDPSPDDNSYDYLNILSRGGLMIPSQKLISHVCDDFAILDLTKSLLKSSYQHDMQQNIY